MVVVAWEFMRTTSVMHSPSRESCNVLHYKPRPLDVHNSLRSAGLSHNTVFRRGLWSAGIRYVLGRWLCDRSCDNLSVWSDRPQALLECSADATLRQPSGHLPALLPSLHLRANVKVSTPHMHASTPLTIFGVKDAALRCAA